MNLAFKKITIEDKKIIDEYFYKYGENSCQHSFAQMMAFESKYGDEYVVLDGYMYVHRSRLDTDTERVYLYPMGDDSSIRHALKLILEDASFYNKSVRFETVTKRAADVITAFYPHKFTADYSRDYSEYIYTKESLEKLDGRKLSSKRNRMRAFWHEYEGRVRIEKITKDNIDDVREYQQKWCGSYEREDVQPIEIENSAVLVGLDNYRALGLRGIVVYIDNEVRAYAYGVELSYNCIDEMIEKADKDYVGLYQMLNNEFAKRVCKDYMYINREEDIGIEGLRTAKLRYCPEYLLDKYILRED